MFTTQTVTDVVRRAREVIEGLATPTLVGLRAVSQNVAGRGVFPAQIPYA